MKHGAARRGDDRPPISRPGEIVGGRYVLEEPLGVGGMAVVRCATDRVTGRRVAVKLLSARFAAQPEGRERFRRELSAAAAIEHPNVVRIFAHGERPGGGPYLVMELLRGESLGDYLRRNTRMPRQLVLALSCLAARGLLGAHQSGIVHRDVKPDNLFLLGPTGAPTGLKILDFGLAKILAADAITVGGVVAGTSAYLAPEQVVGDPVDARTDVYALGVVMFRALTGRLPFLTDSQREMLARHVLGHPPRPSAIAPSVDASCDTIVLSALRKNPDNRYASMAALRDDLDRALGRLPGAPRGAPLARVPDAYLPGSASARSTLAFLAGDDLDVDVVSARSVSSASHPSSRRGSSTAARPRRSSSAATGGGSSRRRRGGRRSSSDRR